MQRIPLRPLLYAATAVLAVAGALSGLSAPQSLAAALLAIFVLIEFRRVPLPQQIASGILLGIAVMVAYPRGMVLSSIGGGLVRTLPFVLVFASVVWLQTAARESPSVKALRQHLSELRPGHRFTALSAAAHFLGSGFNLAGVALLAPMFEGEAATGKTGVRMRTAVLWGFGSATCWSPLYVGTAAILASVPGARWIEALPYGLAFGLYFLFAGSLYDRLFRRTPPRVVGASGPSTRDFARPAGRLVVSLGVLFAAIISLVELFALPLTVAIALVAPGYALVWLWSVYRHTSPGRVLSFSGEVFHSLPRMRSETTLFVCANIFGYVMADLAGAGVSIEVPLPDGGLFVQVAILLLAYLAVSAVGVHPIVSVVVFVSTIDPATLPLPLPLLVATMMALWGVGTSVSPFSGTTLYMGQLSSVSSFRIAWAWNGPFCLLATLGLAALVALLA